MSNLGGGLRAVDWANAKIERFEKNFYAEDKRVTARSDREIEEFKRVKEIKVGLCYLLIAVFSSFFYRSRDVESRDLLHRLTNAASQSI